MGVFHNLLMAAATGTGGNGTGNYSLWSWGWGNSGILGHGTIISKSSPTQIGSLTDWTPNIAAVQDSVWAIKNDGRLWAWGDNSHGLGLGDASGRSSPVQVGASSDWYYVGRGPYAGYAINTSGELYTVGLNSAGQLGLGDTTTRSYLTQVGSSTDWAGCIGGYLFTAAVKTDGTSWAWGTGHGNGRYFKDSETDYSSPVQSGSDTDRWGASSYPPSGGWENGIEMQKVLAGGYWHTSLIKSDGTLWSAGWNGSGGLGFAGDESSPSQVGSGTDWEGISAGNFWGLGIKDGEGLTWGGYNTNGNLGNGTTDMVLGTHYSWGSTVSQASASFESSGVMQTAMVIDGELWVAGRNNYGQLGTGNTTDYSSPVQVGSDTNWVKVICTGQAMLGIKEE